MSQINNQNKTSTATLLISAVGPGDSGMYSCVPPGSHPASVLVHVQKGKFTNTFAHERLLLDEKRISHFALKNIKFYTLIL